MKPSIGVHPIAGALGAEISGVDLSRHLDDETIAALRGAWLEHLVIFFRDLALSPAQLLAFARRFGDVIEYPFVRGLGELHNPVNDYHGYRRLMHRVTVAGNKPTGPSRSEYADRRVEMEPHVAIPRHEAPPRLPVALGAVDTEENPR